MHLKLMCTFIIVYLICFGLIYGIPKKYSNHVLLVSMDGFRWDYIERASTPNFDRMAKSGTRSRYMNSTFITKTFPSHYTIVTGLYEESHGIVGNRMYDPLFNSTFNLGTKESRWWDAGEPIWVTARKHNLSSATYFWVGSESRIHGYYPNIWLPYNKSHPFKPRIDKVMEWFTKDKINIANLYFHEPDGTGHKYGPDSPEVLKMVTKMDGILGYILDSLEKNNLTDVVNLIVLSDHGMTEIDFQNKVIDISTMVNTTEDILFTVDAGPIMHIMPAEDRKVVFEKLKKSSNPHWTVYLKESIPERWHYKNNRRVMPIFAVAAEGWSITTSKKRISSYTYKGAHGYDNALMSMKPIFYAMGPNIRQNYVADTFKSVDIYPLMCEILEIVPSANNGSINRVQSFIVPYTGHASTNGARQFQTVYICLFSLYFVIYSSILTIQVWNEI